MERVSICCKYCGASVAEAFNCGAWLMRVNEPGVLPGTWACTPSCAGSELRGDDLVAAAIEDNDTPEGEEKSE